MNRITLWLMTGLTGWLTLKSLRAHGAIAAASPWQAERGDGHSPTPRKFPRERGDRGRAADRPGEIPPRGWKDILVRTYHSLSDDRVIALAAA